MNTNQHLTISLDEERRLPLRVDPALYRECPVMQTLLDARVEVEADGHVNVTIYGLSLDEALAEMRRG